MKKATYIGKQLRVAMAERDMSGEDLARKVGCTRACINNIVLGKRVGKKTLQAIEDCLGIELIHEEEE